MDKFIHPFKYNGQIYANSSKSYFQRVLAIASLSNSSCKVFGDPKNDDVKTAINICKKIGVEIIEKENYIIVNSSLNIKKNSININSGESGLSTRIFGVLLTSMFNSSNIVGYGTLNERDMFFSELEQLGVICKSNNNKLPISLVGRLKSGIITIDGTKGSQLLSGLLLTLPFLKGDSIIKVKGLVSKPYVLMTIQVLKDFGVFITNNSFEEFVIKGNQQYQCHEYSVEGDWSGAAFHLVGAAISGSVLVKGLNLTSLQADIKILDVLELCGAHIVQKSTSVLVKKNKLQAFNYDATDCPDLFPPIVALAACCKGNSFISGVGRLENKESNRAVVLQSEFKKLGVKILILDDIMIVHGTKKLIGANVNSHKDHRIAMALSVMASVTNEKIIIESAEAVNKSYSNFYSDLELIGANK